jgi:chromosome segregation ATPase
VKHGADATVKKADGQMKGLLKEPEAEADAAAKKLQQVQDTAAKKLEEVQHAAAKELQLVQDDLVKAKAGLNYSNAKLDEKISQMKDVKKQLRTEQAARKQCIADREADVASLCKERDSFKKTHDVIRGEVGSEVIDHHIALQA